MGPTSPDELPAGAVLIAHTDGACSGNPDPGGWRVVLGFDGFNLGVLPVVMTEPLGSLKPSDCYTGCVETAISLSGYKVALVVLGSAAVVVPMFHRLRLSPVLGFILVGITVGPFGFSMFSGRFPWLAAVTINSAEAIEPVASLGVALLLFMIGLELSFERLWLMRRMVFGLGAAQVAACAAVLTGAALWLHHPARSAIVIGLALAMSSTAVVLQVLSEEKRVNSTPGRTSFAVLLFQDLAVVPVLFALGALAPHSQASGVVGLALAIGQALLTVAGIVTLGRLVLRPLFRAVARTRSPESFVAACLLVVIATSLATAAAGLSMALGALIGGLLLASTEYRRQVEVTIEPFKGLLVGVFLISIGMSLDLRVVAAHPGLVLGGACGLVLLKLALTAGLARAFGVPWAAGLQTGLLLGPGGEFSFVIVTVAVSQALLGPEAAEPVLLVAALTMAIIPLLSLLGRSLVPRLIPPRTPDSALLVPASYDAAPRVIVAGFGRVGQTVAAMLEVHKLPYVAVDGDADRVAQQRARGKPVYYGDITQSGLLDRLHLETARALVVTLDDPGAADAVVAYSRAERQDLLIVARARDAGHAAHLYRTGASDAVPETVEASLQLSEAVLIDLGVAMGPVIASIHEKRAELQAGIRAMAPGAEVRTLGRRRLRDALHRVG
jgi:K+:H+ antiporter